MTPQQRAVAALAYSIHELAEFTPEDLADHDVTLMMASAGLYEIYKRTWESKMLRDHPYKRDK